MEQEILSGITTVLVALLGGDRAISAVRNRKNGYATKDDIQGVKDLVTEYHGEFKEHKAFHLGRESKE